MEQFHSTSLSVGLCHEQQHLACLSRVLFGVILLLMTSRDGVDVSAKVLSSHMSPRIIDTQFGKLRGVLLTIPTFRGGTAAVELYRGLQYASLLGGELRFMPPTRPMEKWDNIKMAHMSRPVCPQRIPDVDKLDHRMPLSRLNHIKRLSQFLVDQSEECLYLNIYVPARAKNETELLPVVVFIHGETYELGTGNAYDGSVMAAFGHVVVITINYRLGVLGFLNTEDGNALGNYALLDQVAALHWIRDNIQPFGGNPNEVTLLGHGYGAALANLLLISPLTKGKNLFRRAIIQSGSAMSTWATASDSRVHVRQLADALNCTSRVKASAPDPTTRLPPEVYNKRLVDCFKSFPAKVLADVELTTVPRYRTAWGPTVDRRTVLPNDIKTLVSKQSDTSFGSTALLIGVTRNEGQIFFGQNELDEGLTEDRFRRVLRTYIRNVYDYHRQKLYDVFAYDYTDWDKPPPVPTGPAAELHSGSMSNEPNTALLDTAIEFLGDGQYVAPAIDLARSHSSIPNSAATYVYCLGSRSPQDPLGSMTASGTIVAGVGGPVQGQGQGPLWPGHGDDLPYVFGAPLVDGIDPFASTYSRSDKLLSDTVLKYWTNFIKYGTPNEPASDDSRSGGRGIYTTWPEYTINTQEYLLIGTKPVVRHHYRGAKMALWLELIPRIHRSDDLGRRFHLLDNHDNQTTFEEDGTRQVLLDEPSSDDDYFMTSSRQTTALTTPTSTTVPTPTVVTSTSSAVPPSSVTKRPTASALMSTAAPRRQSTARTSAKVTAAASSGQGVIDKVSGNVPLSVTVAVGCTLLLLNILVFVGMYCQKRKVRLKFSVATPSNVIGRPSCGGGGVMMTSHDDVKSYADRNGRPGTESDNNSHASSLSSYSQHGAGSQTMIDCKQQLSMASSIVAGRNVRFCESSLTTSPTQPPPLPPDGPLYINTSAGCRAGCGYSLDSDHGYSDGRRTFRHPCRASPPLSNNHCNNPSTTV